MALPPAFALINSPFNAFLFAPLGEQENGTPISVLSALTRLGLDPWEEAARLSELPVGTAAQLLAPVIAESLGGRRELADTQKIAARVVRLLPKRVSATQTSANGNTSRGIMKLIGVLLVCLSLAAAVLTAKMDRGQPSSENVGASAPSYATRSMQD